jgi:hypothetical protein
MLGAVHIDHGCTMAESPKPSKPTGRDLDRDPETGQPEDHLGGVVGGAFAGGAAGGVAGAVAVGAATGTIAGGPLGTVVGAAVGAVAGAVIGGVAGKALAEAVNPEHEHDHWRREFPRRPYAQTSPYSYDDYSPAYRYGYERFPFYGGRPFEDVEAELSRDWSTARDTSRLEWEQAREAARDAYDRLAHFGEREAPAEANRG